jgi:RNA-binding protein YlmH
MASSSENIAGVRGFIPPQTDAEKLFMHRVEELCQTAQKRGIPRYSNFLSDREQDLAAAAANRCKCACFHFWGGTEQAERRVFCVEPEDSWQENPVCAIRISVHAQAGAELPGHRDYLGSVLGLGLDRGCVGDFFPDTAAPDTVYAFVLEDKADFICAELLRVGSFSVSVSRSEGIPASALIPPERKICQATVPSLRADSVLAAMLHASRTQAAEWIAAGKVEINHVPIRSAHEEIYAADLFTIHGRGRFRLESVDGKSRKDRLFISYFQY